MPVKKDASGRRYVELELEVPGSPEQVWEAIATGPGISSWFVPTQVEEREGGSITFDLGADMQARAVLTAWEPGRRFAYEERDWAGTAPPLASEFTIASRSGGGCTLRLVHSLFASGDDWDDQLESIESGWPSFFEVLRMYLGEYPGQQSALVRAQAQATVSEPEGWAALVRGFGLENPRAGERVGSPAPGAPEFAATIVRIGRSKHKELLVRLERPAPGAGIFAAYTWADRVIVAVTLYLYGDDAAAVASREEPRWQAYVGQLLPMPVDQQP